LGLSGREIADYAFWCSASGGLSDTIRQETRENGLLYLVVKEVIVVSHRDMGITSEKRAFTLIEVLVVVAIIALLVAILLPSLRNAREEARSAVCASRMRQLTTAGSMWLLETGKKGVPAHRGWAPHVLKAMSGETTPFTCPSDLKPGPIAPMFISQYRSGFRYPMLATDSGYFRRNREVDSNGAYRLDMETEADVSGGDKDFDDATIHVTPLLDEPSFAEVWARKRSTGRELWLHDYRGRVLEKNFSTTARYKQPILWGSYGMNLSAAIPGAKSWNALYLDYTDWSAVVERKLGVRATDGHVRGDGPNRPEWIAPRHVRTLNVGFVDTHVDRLHPHKLALPADENAGSIWHPPRPPGWMPPRLSVE
jgi:prepilin-type N-terminal cleavage/methylation domain-containing protein